MSALCLKLARRKAKSSWTPAYAPAIKNYSSIIRGGMSPPMQVTEDTPPDMLAGYMTLKLVLPSGKKVKISVERSLPMMDLLVQVTTSHKLSPAAHVLQPYGENGVLPYKPSTPIGALDTVMVHVVPKHMLTHNQSNKVAMKQISQPFEQTYRIQVHLPRNQLYVLRANGRTSMEDILFEVCKEKNLDSSKYCLRHPKDMGRLKGETTIAEYKHNQLVLVSNRDSAPSPVSSQDIMTAIQNLNNNLYTVETTRSLSPDSSTSPVHEPAKPLRRKKQPAPKPPSTAQRKSSSPSKAAPVISHSRTSSDSSGYHEASVLSESPYSNNSLPDSLPRRSKLPSSSSGGGTHSNGASNLTAGSGALSKSLGNLTQPEVNHKKKIKPASSTSNLLAPAGRKKRPAPPPPPSMKPVQEDKVRESEESKAEEVKEEPKMEAEESLKEPAVDLRPVESSVESRPVPEDLVMADEEIDRIFNQATRDHTSLESGVDLLTDSGRDSSDSNEVVLSSQPVALPSPLPSIPQSSWDIVQLPAPALFQDDPQEVRAAVLSELTSIISRRSEDSAPMPEPDRVFKPLSLHSTSTLDNFSISSYSQVKRNNSLKKSDTLPTQLKRSSSNVSSNTKTLPRPQVQSGLLMRKTTSELNLNSEKRIDNRKENIRFESPELQSLQVLRTILPQLTRSQGSLDNTESITPPASLPAPVQRNGELEDDDEEHKKRKVKEEEEEKKIVTNIVSTWEKTKKERNTNGPAVSLSTWGERPKRQVSIKSDRDYVFGNVESRVKAVEQVKPVMSSSIISNGGDDEKPKVKANSSVYKNLETGNTRPLRYLSVSRVPIVKSVELKKPYRDEWKVQQQESRGVDKLASIFESTKIDLKAPVIEDLKSASVTNRYTSVVGIGGDHDQVKVRVRTSTRVIPPASPDPRELLLASIRDFGGLNSLKKVRS